MYYRETAMEIRETTGGVCAAKGFKASGVHCGVRRNISKKDLALIVSEKRANAACVYTANLVKSAPIKVTREHVADGYAQAVICNSGNANTCNANGIEIAQGMADLVERYTGIKADDVIVGSTGVIGQPMTMEPFENGMGALVDGLGANSRDAAYAIMTTDTRVKEIAVEFDIDGKVCRMGGIAKGSGMIHPNMATMLVFITTDCAITTQMLQKALSEDVKTSFNMVSVDGDTSTNDTVAVLANGLADNPIIASDGQAFDVFRAALRAVTVPLCKMIAKDGEGATKMITCKVQGAATERDAGTAAKAVICSSLVKAAMFGADANCGRILCAIGYSGADVDVDGADVWLSSRAGELKVCENGLGLAFDEEKARETLTEDEITITVRLRDGDASAEAWGCDLTYDYVKINGDYRS